MTTLDVQLGRDEALQTAGDIAAVLDAIGGNAIDCSCGALERILVDLLEVVEAVVRGDEPVRSQAAAR